MTKIWRGTACERVDTRLYLFWDLAQKPGGVEETMTTMRKLNRIDEQEEHKDFAATQLSGCGRFCQDFMRAT